MANSVVFGIFSMTLRYVPNTAVRKPAERSKPGSEQSGEGRTEQYFISYWRTEFGRKNGRGKNEPEK